MSASTIHAQKKLVEQLQAESMLPRKPVSQSLADMIAYVNEHSSHDVLLNGFINKKGNPFVEKGGCSIL